MRRCAAPLWGALLILLAARATHAGTEEFSTFGVFAQEQDDESLLDHLLTRPPSAWRDSWEQAPQAVRTSQGCLTSGQWFIDTRLKVRAPLGGRARFGVDLRQEESDRFAYQYLDFSFRVPIRAGFAGLTFRPLFDKSRQDVGFFWEAAEETSATVARLAFGLEDVFNNLWAFRQTRVGETSESYERHPFEPAAWLRVSRPAWRAEILGQWLTPSRKRLAPEPGGGVEPRVTLWGALAFASFEARSAAVDLELVAAGRQALTRRTLAASSLYGGDYRRQWWIESALRGRLAPHWEAEARWIYQERFEDSDPPFVDATLGAVDRVAQLEVRWRWERWALRAGGAHDRVTVGLAGDPVFTHGSRTESRGYLGLSARLGAVWFHAVEGFELDPEPYEVWGIHDKAFLHAQTSF